MLHVYMIYMCQGQGGISAYNAGMKNVFTYEHTDVTTTGEEELAAQAD